MNVKLNTIKRNENIRCGLDNEVNSISKASHLNSYLLTHPYEEVKVEIIQKCDAILGILWEYEVEKGTIHEMENITSMCKCDTWNEQDNDATI